MHSFYFFWKTNTRYILLQHTTFATTAPFNTFFPLSTPFLSFASHSHTISFKWSFWQFILWLHSLTHSPPSLSISSCPLSLCNLPLSHPQLLLLHTHSLSLTVRAHNSTLSLSDLPLSHTQLLLLRTHPLSLLLWLYTIHLYLPLSLGFVSLNVGDHSTL